jgi:hypothetical protein
MKSKIVALLLLICSPAALAGSGSGLVTHIEAYQNAVIFSTGNISGTPACNTASQWVIDASTSQGKIAYTLLLTAMASGKTVSVWGSNACPSWWNNAEFPNSVTINASP